MNIEAVRVEKEDAMSVILAQSHFIKTVEDAYEAIITSHPSIRFGIAFNESSGPRLVRTDGNDSDLIQVAERNARRIGAGHLLVIVISGAFPINVLRAIREINEIACIYCATSNPLSVLVAVEGEARGVLGVMDGLSPLGVEGEKEKKERHELLRKLGYKR